MKKKNCRYIERVNGWDICSKMHISCNSVREDDCPLNNKPKLNIDKIKNLIKKR